MSPRPEIVVIDEVQRLPELLNEVHLMIEEHRLRFVLTASSARVLPDARLPMARSRATGAKPGSHHGRRSCRAGLSHSWQLDRELLD
jgi:hypothetical protein